MNSPSLFKRIACLLYESILVFAILFVAGIIYRAIFGDPANIVQQRFFFMYSWLIAGAYFVFCWVKGGQTLAMQTWRVQLTSYDAKPVTLSQALRRYLMATFSLMFFGLGFVWAIFDRESLYLHDRLTGGRLLNLPKK
ncbi:MAG: RDD family protein [Candidatus Methylopumilus sp.]